MNFFNNCGLIDNHLGIVNIPIFPKKSHFLKTMVLQNEQYRPDLVSYRLFKNTNYSWIIDEMNDFYHGFKEYEIGRQIFYLKKEDLVDLGIIR